MRSWKMKSIVYSGEDSLTRLAQFQSERILFVCDPFLIGTLSYQRINQNLNANNKITIFSKIIPDPPIEVVSEGILLMQEIRPTVIIAVGGGSAIDTAKAILYSMAHIENYQIKKFIAIPTTSGTGSEVTSASVVTDEQNKIKYPIFSDSLIPDEAILDAELVVSCPKPVTAYSGMDVLTHALESLVAKNRSDYTAALAEKAIKLVFTYLKQCYEHGDDLEARIKMHQASCLAGLAFDKSGLGINHAIAHQLGGQFGIPHGLANTMLLSESISINSRDKKSLGKYAQIAILLGLGNANLDSELLVLKLKKAIIKLAQDLNCPMSLKEYGIDSKIAKEKAEVIAKYALKDITYRTNPIEVSAEEIKKIYHNIYS